MADIRETIIGRFPNKKIAVIGDLVADQFLNGTIARVSREAPVFILRHEETVTLPGAAANAAANVASIGGTPILLGLIGGDANGRLLTAALETAGVDTETVAVVDSITTTAKQRVLAGQNYAARQQLLRIDYENAANVPEDAKRKLIAGLDSVADLIDGIIVSDYGYGAVFPEIFSKASEIAKRRNIPLVVDSRYRLTSFSGATAATPNREEVEQIVGKDFSPADCESLRDKLACEALLVTNGNKGMTLFESGREPLHIAVSGSSEPVDVTGAGDTVIAVFALGLASGLSFAEAASVANHAGGIVVMKKATATVTTAELLATLASSEPLSSSRAS